jgi:hypothetical protein
MLHATVPDARAKGASERVLHQALSNRIPGSVAPQLAEYACNRIMNDGMAHMLLNRVEEANKLMESASHGDDPNYKSAHEGMPFAGVSM